MKILYYAGLTLTRVLSKVLFRIKICGQENIPAEGGFILASNHISNYDPPLVGSWTTREMYFLGKRELFDNPLFGGIIRRTNALPISRGAVDREAIRGCQKVVSDGYGLTFFPEGTRSKTGEFLEPKLGIGMIASRAKCPIVPTYINGSNRLKDCLLGRDRMSITYGRPIPAEWVTARPAGKDGYIEITRQVMKRIGEIRDTAVGLK